MAHLLAEASAQVYHEEFENLKDEDGTVWESDGQSYHSKIKVLRAKIWTSGSHMLLAYRGTDPKNPTDLAADVGAAVLGTFTPWKGGTRGGVRVGKGWFEAYSGTAREQVFSAIQKHRPDSIWITGHSLGGALASLLFYDLLYSFPGPEWGAVVGTVFGSPRVGNEGWANDVDRVIQEHCAQGRNVQFTRVNAPSDPVLLYPPGPVFEHVGEVHEIDNADGPPWHSHKMVHYRDHYNP